MSHHHDHDSPIQRILHSKLVWAGFIAAAAYYLWAFHRNHAVSILPFLLALACPLMHLFHGHGHHAESKRNDEKTGHDHTQD